MNRDETSTATCDCQQLRVQCQGHPVKVSLCSCINCQRRTGSAFGIAAFYDKSELTIQGGSTAYTRLGDSGNAITFHFCPNCGSTVYWERDHMPDVIAVAVGAFADPEFPPPSRAVYEQHQPQWVHLDI